MKQFLLTMLLVLTTSLTAMAQVTGTVKDADTDEGLPAATVMEKGTTNGTSTDVNGEFSINVDEGEILKVSFIGYLTKEVIAEDGMVISRKRP